MDTGARGISAFLVPLDARGVSRQVYQNIGARLTERGSLFLNGVRVPKRYRIGDESSGFYQAMIAFDFNRAMITLRVLVRRNSHSRRPSSTPKLAECSANRSLRLKVWRFKWPSISQRWNPHGCSSTNACGSRTRDRNTLKLQSTRTSSCSFSGLSHVIGIEKAASESIRPFALSFRLSTIR